MDYKYFSYLIFGSIFLLNNLIIIIQSLPILDDNDIYIKYNYYNASVFNTKYKSYGNFLCPNGCHCMLPSSNYHQIINDDNDTKIQGEIYLHAKCTSLDGLMNDDTLNATLLPIHSIDLSYLNLTRLPIKIIKKFNYLTMIDLSHNELHDIGHLGKHIKKLNLKYNRLTSNNLKKLPSNIQILNLQHNDITHLPLDFMKLTQLNYLELSQNHINCTCETLIVRNWLQERNVFMEQPILCSYPKNVKDKSWLQLKQKIICENLNETHKDDMWAYNGDNDDNGDNGDNDDWLKENELMLGDEPCFEDIIINNDDNNIDGSGDQQLNKYSNNNGCHNNDDDKQIADDNDEELKKDFIPLSKPLNKERIRKILNDVNDVNDVNEIEIEGSGEGDAEFNAINNDDLIMDGSGSGIKPILLSLPNLHFTTTDNYDHSEKNIEENISSLSPDIFKINMGIFEKDAIYLDSTTEDLYKQQQNNIDVNDVNDVNDDMATRIVPSSAIFGTQGPQASHEEELDNNNNNIEMANADSIKDANLARRNDNGNDDAPATYLLLGIIAFIFLSMLAYVSIKRCKQRRSHRLHDYANDNDAERAQRELVVMDKDHLGKPLRNGVPEHLPLLKKENQTKILNEKVTDNFIDNKNDHDNEREHDQKQPLLNGSGTTNVKVTQDLLSINKDGNVLQLQDSHEYYPISPRYPTPQSPRASKYCSGGSGNGSGSGSGGIEQILPFSDIIQEPNNNIDNDVSDMPPKSPKSMGRYSPVYSPETGRVKIKLTEIAKPKTPMLVTRTRSNAGDIIMTPVVHNEQHHYNNNNSDNATIHASATNGHAKAH